MDHPHWNQSPPHLDANTTTRQDFNGMINSRTHRGHSLDHEGNEEQNRIEEVPIDDTPPLPKRNSHVLQSRLSNTSPSAQQPSKITKKLHRARDILFKYAQFVGPGFLVSVAYIDPGNYQTDINAGAATRYSLLFIVLMSNLFAIFLQTLCIKLGSVTGLNLAENCRRHLPPWLNIILYILSESAIIATDLAEVIGSAIALELLLHIPLVAGCVLTLVDVLIILIFYSPDGSMGRLRMFEYFVMMLVFGVIICFCIQLSYIRNTTIGEVFKGYLPSSAVVNGNGVYLSCGILGATVMPHSLFLGSGVVQPRLRQFDMHIGNATSESVITPIVSTDNEAKYRPSIQAIRSCLRYSVFELASSLFTFALFVNSAILIVAGSALYHNSEAQDADLFGIHALLSHTLAPAAGTVFALALLLSGTSAGIVCTMAGQMVSEGMIRWTVKPWVRRLLTRGISVVPSVVVAASVGKAGLNTALTVSQVILSVILPFVTAPLVYFTCRSRYMMVAADRSTEGDNVRQDNHIEEDRTSTRRRSEVEVTTPRARAVFDVGEGDVCMKNSWPVTIIALLIWGVLVVMNISLLVLVGLGKA